MPRLIHLNGPPAIGKSTLAARYADEHPGTLNLDIDRLLPLVGGWTDPANDTHLLLRPAARAMARAHLAGGHDVVLPQYLARLDEIEAFAASARSAGADFREIVLLADADECVARFTDRPDETTWDRHNRTIVDEQGGDVFLRGMLASLLAILPRRPDAVVLTSVRADPDATYRALLSQLDGR